MGSVTPPLKQPWIETPLIPSPDLSRAAGCNILLKLENLQPSGSFKSRGVGNLVARAAASSPEATASAHFYCSSGGNAGLACAHAAIALSRPCTIVTPITAPAVVLDRLRSLGARVVVSGADWKECDAYMRDVLMAEDKHAVYVPPFDHPHVWEGHSSMVREIEGQVSGPLHGIVDSVGGGGLLNGIMQGVEDWTASPRPAVVAVETKGADSLNASILAGEHVTIPGITSIATSLGATRVSDKTWDWAYRKARLGGKPAPPNGPPAALEGVVVSDAEAAIACIRFGDAARIVVEPACGATIATAYNGALRRVLGAGLSDEEWRQRTVVLVVCGGSNVNISVLEGYRQTYGSLVEW
ncbi:L-serine dehydratase [Plectosphaerella plurivora]|uniref:L-serine ammonia-lyase n=1 Tax=Plectosphaerella plurivora TaxID=936078 RepID=A0A9P8VF35_9PEZI|nr:L-serine dehydratase [Plectosphaerella plurivora]